MTGLTPTLNEAGERLYREVLTKSISRLLNDELMPGTLAQKGRAWLVEQRRPTAALEQLKARTLEVLADARHKANLRELIEHVSSTP